MALRITLSGESQESALPFMLRMPGRDDDDGLMPSVLRLMRTMSWPALALTAMQCVKAVAATTAAWCTLLPLTPFHAPEIWGFAPFGSLWLNRGAGRRGRCRAEAAQVNACGTSMVPTRALYTAQSLSGLQTINPPCSAMVWCGEVPTARSRQLTAVYAASTPSR